MKGIEMNEIDWKEENDYYNDEWDEEWEIDGEECFEMSVEKWKEIIRKIEINDPAYYVFSNIFMRIWSCGCGHCNYFKTERYDGNNCEECPLYPKHCHENRKELEEGIIKINE